jgi:hypothetical protein
MSRNDRDYRLGGLVRLNAWNQYLLTDNLAISVRGEHVGLGNINGADPQTPNAAISTNVESFRGGYWYNFGIGSQFLWKGNSLNAESVPTIVQDLKGIQLETDDSIIVSFYRAF